jgi:hypothetical protein
MQPPDQHRPGEPVSLEAGTHPPMLTFLSGLVNKV